MILQHTVTTVEHDLIIVQIQMFLKIIQVFGLLF